MPGTTQNLVELPGSAGGYDMRGMPCNNFSLAGDPVCLFQIQMMASIDCPSASAICAVPIVRVVSEIVLGANSPLSTKNFLTYNISDKKIMAIRLPPSEFVCATGQYNIVTGARSSEPGNTGLPAVPGDLLPDVMAVRPYDPANGGSWGITCINGYQATGCTVSDNGARTATGRPKSGSKQLFQNSCLATNRERDAGDTLSVVCCGVR
jgi:hypothetical protein